MRTTLERLAAEPKHDSSILLPNVWDGLLRVVTVQCPCGASTSVRDGVLSLHDPAAVWDVNGQRRPVIADAYATGVRWHGCRYTGRTVTLAAALVRDAVLTEAERHTRDTTLRRLEAGITDSAPEGYALPKPIAELFALAEANGWAKQQAWAPRDDGYVLSARVGRLADEGRRWQYDLMYFVTLRTARRTQFGLSVTPDRRGPHDTPSIKAIRAVITANPVEG